MPCQLLHIFIHRGGLGAGNLWSDKWEATGNHSSYQRRAKYEQYVCMIKTWFMGRKKYSYWMNQKLKIWIGIAEKTYKTRRDHWGGNVNHKSLLTLCLHSSLASWCSSICLGVKIGICGLHYHLSDSVLFCGFFQQSLFLFWLFPFL